MTEMAGVEQAPRRIRRIIFLWIASDVAWLAALITTIRRAERAKMPAGQHVETS
jgi:hypothetical protein